jgi:putative SOS response-associated peptidase YedK
MKWGLVPSWVRDESIGYKTINAKAETVADKPAFRGAFKKRRCLVPASGFYEWKKEGKKRFPLLFRPTSGLFGLAGLWETWQDGALAVESFTIITTDANGLVRSVHDRMPVILDRADFAAWLVPSGEKERDLALLRPCPAEWMTATAVNPYVNDARHEGPHCVEPPDDQPPLFPDGA